MRSVMADVVPAQANGGTRTVWPEYPNSTPASHTKGRYSAKSFSETIPPFARMSDVMARAISPE